MKLWSQLASGASIVILSIMLGVFGGYNNKSRILCFLAGSRISWVRKQSLKHFVNNSPVASPLHPNLCLEC